MEVDEGSDKENADCQDSEEEDLRAAVNTVEVEADNGNQPVQVEKHEVRDLENDKTESNSEVVHIQNESVAEDEEEEEDYEVEEIVDYKMCKKTKVGMYRVKWWGWASESDTWEPLENLEQCSEHLCSFSSPSPSSCSNSSSRHGEETESVTGADRRADGSSEDSRIFVIHSDIIRNNSVNSLMRSF